MLKPRETIRAKVNFINDHCIDFDFYCTEPWMLEVVRDKGYFTHEPEVMAAIVNFVKPGDLCIDAGANIGYHSLLMAKLVGEHGRILAFEPDPYCFETLKDNLALNNIDDICCPVPFALSDGNAKNVDFYLVKKKDCPGEYETGYSSFCKYTNVDLTKIGVDVVRLDDVMQPEMPPVRFLKIDCEGAEDSILRGAENLLRRGVDAVVCEFNFSILDNNMNIRKYMAALGYDFFYLFDSGHLPECIALEVVIQPSEHKRSFNGLFAKKAFVRKNWRYCVAT